MSRSSRSGMAGFWDERARENAPYFVDTALDYAETDLDRFWAGGPSVVDEILSRLEAPPIEATDELVEIGCGLGRLTRPLAGRAARVHALDVSAEMLERAREANPHLSNVEWILGDGTSLAPLAGASADVVFSHVVFQHIPDPSITLGYVREMGRVLRPGGWAAFQVSNDPSVHRRRREPPLRRLASRLGRTPSGQDHPAWLGSAVDLSDLRQAATSAALDVERVVGENTQFCLVLLRRRPA